MKKIVKDYIEKNKIKASKRIETQLEASKLVSRYLQLYEQNKIETNKYRNLIYGAKIYSEILRNKWQDELEARLEAIESRQNEKRSN